MWNTDSCTYYLLITKEKEISYRNVQLAITSLDSQINLLESQGYRIYYSFFWCVSQKWLFTQTFSVYIQCLLIQLLGFLYDLYFFTCPQNILYQIELVKLFSFMWVTPFWPGAVIWVFHTALLVGLIDKNVLEKRFHSIN